MEESQILQCSLESIQETEINVTQQKEQLDIKGISIPLHGFPFISQGHYEDMIRTYFYSKDVHHVVLNDSDYLVVSPFYFNDSHNINYLATNLYRSYKPAEQSFQDLVYGPALIIGKDDQNDNFTSVSQQVIESVLNIFTRDSYGIKYVPQ